MLLYVDLFPSTVFCLVFPTGDDLLQLRADQGVLCSATYLWVFSFDISFDEAKSTVCVCTNYALQT